MSNIKIYKHMKSLHIILSAVFIVIFTNLNGQYFTGGSFSILGTGDKTESGSSTVAKSSSFGLAFSPSIGKFLSDKMALGLELDLGTSRNTSGVNQETTNINNTIGLSPFIRYYALKWNKVAVFGKANIGVDFTNSKVKSGGIINDGPKNTQIFVSFEPGLSIDVSDHLSFLTTLNFLGFGYSYTIRKDDDYKEHISNFNLGANLDNIVTLGSIKLGAIYKF
jgi:outer membrane protein